MGKGETLRYTFNTAQRELSTVIPLEANLYLDQIDVQRYCLRNTPNASHEHCQARDAETCLDDCPLLGPPQRQALKIALKAKEYLPSIPAVTVPQPIQPDLISMNEPDENSLVLATANNSLTFEVLTTVWAQGVTPAYLLLVDCLGNTVDMAMVFGEFKPERLKQALTRSGLEVRLSHRRIIVPGLTAPLAERFREATEWDIEVGPICAAELPLFLGDSWVF